MRIAILALGTEGDVRPLITLAHAMQARGAEVVIGAADTHGDVVRAHGHEFRRVGLGLEPTLGRHAALLTRHPLQSLRLVGELVRAEVEASFDAAIEVACDVDLVVSGVHPVAPSAAEATGVPHRTLLFCPQLLRSRHHPPPGVPWLDLPAGCNELLWGLASQSLDIGVADTLNRRRRGRGLEPITRVYDHMIGPAPIVASSAALGELPPDAPKGIVQVGALAVADEHALDPELERFLERGDPPVVVGFGGMPDPHPARTTHMIVDALGACSRRGVILAGRAGLGRGGVPPGVMVVASAPHDLLFARAAAVVHHGGSGTTHVAARAGVPQVVVPHLTGQFYWGHQIWRLGLGPRPVPRSALLARRLAPALDEALSDHSIAARAQAIASMVASTHGLTTLVHMLEAIAAGKPTHEALPLAHPLPVAA